MSDFASTSRALLRETILTALDELVAERPWTDISLAQLAERTGVSRQTLYNAIGGREQIAEAYVLWSADRFLDDVDRAIGEHPDDLRTALHAGVRTFLDLAPSHPLVRALLASSGTDDLLTYVSSPAATPLIDAAADRIRLIARRHWPELDDLEDGGPAVDAVVDAIVRLSISHLTVPSSRLDATTAIDLAVGPAIEVLAAKAAVAAATSA